MLLVIHAAPKGEGKVNQKHLSELNLPPLTWNSKDRPRPVFVIHPSDAMADVQFTEVPFEESGPIPSEYTCDGEDVSPPLAWTDPPAGTDSLVLIVDDPDAPVPGSFTHWVLFNLPPTTTALPRDYSDGDLRLEPDGPSPVEGVNDFGDVGYGGPCPPGREEHRYVFFLSALDTTLSLDRGADPDEVTAAMDGHVLAKAEFVGTYQRR